MVGRQQLVRDLLRDAFGKCTQGQVDEELREVDLGGAVHHRVEVDEDGSVRGGDELVEVEVPVERADTLASDVAAPPRRRRQQVGHDRLDRGVGMGELPRLLAHLGEQAVDRHRSASARSRTRGEPPAVRRWSRLRPRAHSGEPRPSVSGPARHASTTPGGPGPRPAARRHEAAPPVRVMDHRARCRAATPSTEPAPRCLANAVGPPTSGTLDAKGGARLRLVADHGDAQPRPQPESRADRRGDDAGCEGRGEQVRQRGKLRVLGEPPHDQVVLGQVVAAPRRPGRAILAPCGLAGRAIREPLEVQLHRRAPVQRDDVRRPASATR